MTPDTLKNIAFRITSKLAVHPLFNQYFQNSEDFLTLTGTETSELDNIFQQPEREIFNHFVTVGERLYDRFQPPFIDVARIVEFAADELARTLKKDQTYSSFARIDKISKVIKNALAKAYFYRSLKETRFLIGQSPENPRSPLALHIHWLEQIVDFLMRDSDNIPERNHLECSFARWLGRMEFELLLQSAGEEKEAQHARTFLAHRKIHQEFDYILSFLKADDFILALSHWSLLYQAVLELRQSIRNLQLNYKEHEEQLFFDFIEHKSNLDEDLYYFLSIRIALWGNNNAIDSKASLELAIHDCLEKADLDGITYVADSEIRLLLQNPNKRSDIDLPEFLEHKLHTFLSQIAKKDGLKSRAVAIDLDSLNAYPAQKISILRQLSYYEAEQNFELVSPQKVEALYKSAVESEVVAGFASKALDEGTLEVFFQPIIDSNEHKKIHVEALVRAPKDDGYLAAESFLRYLEQQERMSALDLFVIQKISQYSDQLGDVISDLSINIHPASFREDEIVEALISLSQKLKQYDISLVVEITEQMFMHDTSPAEILSLEHGISFSLDDFGSGYSNLIQLIGLAERGVVKELKIDGSLVKQIDKDDKVFEVIETITKIADTLGITPIIMEYVESEVILNKLKRLNANIYFQGYFFDRPLPIETLRQKYNITSQEASSA